MRAPMSPLIRRILRDYPEEANEFVRAQRNGKFVKIKTEDGTLRYFGPSSAGRPHADNIVEIDLSSSASRVPA